MRARALLNKLRSLELGCNFTTNTINDFWFTTILVDLYFDAVAVFIIQFMMGQVEIPEQNRKHTKWEIDEQIKAITKQRSKVLLHI